jgi:hypothetical protein
LGLLNISRRDARRKTPPPLFDVFSSETEGSNPAEILRPYDPKAIVSASISADFPSAESSNKEILF